MTHPLIVAQVVILNQSQTGSIESQLKPSVCRLLSVKSQLIESLILPRLDQLAGIETSFFGDNKVKSNRTLSAN